ncbi:UNVERIFIED_CONTAM: hypothetical protein ABIC26_001216 [Paenibacillus sp. PvR008]
MEGAFIRKDICEEAGSWVGRTSGGDTGVQARRMSINRFQWSHLRVPHYNHGFNPWLFVLKNGSNYIKRYRTYWMFEFAIQFS